jgi:polysaccharide export outer membrane protein
VNKKQRRYNIILFLFIVFIVSPSFFVLAEELSSSSDESDIKMEQRVIHDADEQKQTQLKEYFRDYYYKQGIDYFKKGQYEQAIAKFQRVLHWETQYEPAIRYIELSKDKIAQRQRLEEERKIAEENARELREKKEARKDIPEEKTERLQAKEVTFAEAYPATIPYRIDKEDVLEVSVWQHPELSKEVIVRPDGMISFPLIGDIQAAGLSVPELDEKITQGLTEFAKKRIKPSISEKAEEKAEYLIGSGDTLDISVWKEPDLSREVIVRPDGKTSFPLIGDLETAGKTLTQLDEEITKALSNYVKEPQVSVMVKSFGWKKEIPQDVFLEDNLEVSVMIKNFGGRKVVILGEVAKPGVYTFRGDIRLIEALALAGDCTKYAVKNNVLIIRGDIRSNPTVVSSNMLAFLKDARLSENVLIQPQDVIFVPRSLIGNINAFVETIAPIVDMVYKGSTVKTGLEGF